MIRSWEEQRRMEGAQGEYFRPGAGSAPRQVLLGIFRGGPRVSAPRPRPPALLCRPARGRHGSGGAHRPATPWCLSPPPSGTGARGGARRAGALELPASAEFPGLADVNSFLPGGKEAAGRRAPEPACLCPLS